MKRKIVLSIAASDTSGGAGIQADLKAFSYAGMRGLAIITCITAQNERKVLSVYPLPTDVIEVQAEALLSKLKPDVTKIGMLYSKEIAECTADLLKKYRIKKVVLDPVLSASTGDSLAKKDLVGSIKDNLLELTYLITPNISEAERLTGIKIKNIADM
ncbi:MAG TPA: hydroxymethylpyrimidine/phosphomethylpyrimidine kinase, partial [Thermoplasmatales archaeon]|nr:hydroxymethylpyrimidine/phosphomethylpyrimidine kinase [Thermoplasmatales archaeon]